MKTDRTVVALLPSPAILPGIEAIRRRHDRNLRWIAPHVTLLHPFLEAALFPEVLPRLARVCAHLSPFELRLERLSSFAQASGHHVLWLVPEPRAPLLSLHDALLSCVPACDDQAAFPGGFVPHLTVGRASGDQQRDLLIEDLQRSWAPLRWWVDRVVVLEKTRGECYQVVRELPLAEAAPGL